MSDLTPNKPIVARLYEGVRRRRLFGAIFISAVCVASTFFLYEYVVAGGNLPTVSEVKMAPRNHAVRSHGWGSHYIYSGRSHYGGGGRIH